MAQKRMFALSVIDSDEFLDLPLSAQALYFHLSMRADDDGFINNHKRIQRTIGCSDKDLHSLINSKFIIPFDSGIIVIRHWKMHNYIQKDRYKETVYSNEKALLTTTESNVYSLADTECIQNVSNLDTECIQNGYTDKIRLDKNSKDKNIYAQIDKQFDAFWSAYPKKKGKQSAEKAFKKIAPDETLLEIMLKALEEQKQSAEWQKDGGQFIPYPASWLNGRRWEDETTVVTEPEPEYWGDVYG